MTIATGKILSGVYQKVHALFINIPNYHDTGSIDFKESLLSGINTNKK